jgi:hypothetical protein
MPNVSRTDLASGLVTSWLNEDPARRELLEQVVKNDPGSQIKLVAELAAFEQSRGVVASGAIEALLEDRSHFARTIHRAAEKTFAAQYGARAHRGSLGDGGVRADDSTKAFGFMCSNLGQRTTKTERVQAVSAKPADNVQYSSMREIYSAAANAPEGIRELLMRQADRLLGEYYKGYAAAFPDPDERETRESLKSYMFDPEMPNYDIRLFSRDGKVIGGAHYDTVEATSTVVMKQALADIAESGGDLSRAQIGELLAGALAKTGDVEAAAERAGDTPSMLGIQYIWVDEENRFGGVGKKTIDDFAAEFSKAEDAPRAIFVEVNDPRLMTKQQMQDDSIDPRIRMAFYDAREFARLDTKYAQLPIEEGMGAVEYLAFLVRMLGPKADSVPAAEYLGIVADYAAGFPKFVRDTPEETYAAVFADPVFQAIVADAAKRESIPLVPILTDEEKRALPARETSEARTPKATRATGHSTSASSAQASA